MAKLNLLPWREERRKRRQQEFLTALGLAALVVAGIVYGVNYQIEQWIQGQEARNQRLEQEIRRLEGKIREINKLEEQREQIEERITVIQDLQAERPEVVHLVYEIADALPNGVYLTSLKQQGGKVTVEGRAESNARVSSFMRRLDASDWLTDPTLAIIQAQERQGIEVSEFRLSVEQAAPDDSDDSEE
jgi:type IV pilus assembly protein PilN